jgi:hypothetical protein
MNKLVLLALLGFVLAAVTLTVTPQTAIACEGSSC